MSDPLERELFPIERELFSYVSKNITVHEKAVESLNDKAKFVLTIIGITSASGITALGIIYQRGLSLDINLLTGLWLGFLMGIISTSLILILHIARKYFLSTSDVYYGDISDFINNTLQEITSVNDYLNLQLASQEIYLSSLEEEIDRLGKQLNRLVINWFFYTVGWVMFILSRFIV